MANPISTDGMEADYISSDQEDHLESHTSLLPHLPHLPLPPLPPVLLQATSTTLNVNSALHRKYAKEAKKMPMRVETCVKGLQGLCLACLCDRIETKGHQTHRCKKWQRYKMGSRQAFEWKKEHFCSKGDKGYCYRCLLNPDYVGVHPEGSAYGQCQYAGIVFEVCWLVIGNKGLLKSLAKYVDEPGLENEPEYIEWLKGKFNDDRKWRNCATLLIVWFYNTFKARHPV